MTATQNRTYSYSYSLIFTFTVISIVIGLSIYTAWQVAYGQENEIINEANELIDAANASLAAAVNASNITDTNISELDDELELDDNSGVGYYDPPYSYAQCLTVFTKEMCDFRFNSD